MSKIHFKYGKVPDRFFNKVQLKAGTRVEMEHTNNSSIAKQIAKAHLKENKNYYKILKRVKL